MPRHQSHPTAAAQHEAADAPAPAHECARAMFRKPLQAGLHLGLHLGLQTGLLIAIAATSASAATPVYRCGNQYSQVPCPEGRIVEATDPRTAAQRAAARRVAEQERNRAAAMERERLAREAASAPAGAASLSPAAPASAASAPDKGRHRVKHPKPKQADAVGFKAVVPRPAASAVPSR